MTEPEPGIYGGVDTHKDLHVAAVVDQTGRIHDVASFQATTTGYRQLLGWMRRHGELVRVGVEGTGSYGAGLARHLAGEGVEVVDVNRPNRQTRRRRGKSDTVDAEAAARAALNGEATAAPKSHDGVVESIRALRIAFCSTRNTRTRIANQLRDLVICAPDQLRCDLETLDTPARVKRAARFRPGELTDPTEGTKAAMRALARQYQSLTVDLDELRGQLDALTAHANPALRDARGVGIDVASILLIAAGDNPERLTSEAAFAALAGAAPVEASSGKTTRHRLNQGGNRQANHALWRIAMVRLTCDPATRAYAERRRAEGKSTREIIRCLKRYIAREIYRLLTHPPAMADRSQLRAARTAAGSDRCLGARATSATSSAGLSPEALTGTPEQIQALPPDILLPVTQAMADSITAIFLCTVPLLAIGVAIAIVVPELPLKDTAHIGSTLEGAEITVAEMAGGEAAVDELTDNETVPIDVDGAAR